jgi:hypothetical protein
MKIIYLCVLGFALAGCASKADDIAASYISPVAYSSYSCQQLREEAARLSAHAAQVAGVQDQKATNDAIATGVAVVLFWPAAFMVKGDSTTGAELARLKGERDAVEQASIEKKCGIQFQRGA